MVEQFGFLVPFYAGENWDVNFFVNCYFSDTVYENALQIYHDSALTWFCQSFYMFNVAT